MVTFAKELVERIADELEARKDELGELGFTDRLGAVTQTIGIRFFTLPTSDRTNLERAVGVAMSERKIQRLTADLPPEMRDVTKRRSVRVTPPPPPRPPLTPERLEEIRQRHENSWLPYKDD